MIDPASLSATFDSLKMAGELVKAIIGTHDSAVVKEKARELTSVIIEAQGQTIGAQQQLARANDEIRELKERIAKMDTWNQEKRRYELVAAGQDRAYAYQLKESERHGQPDHYVCPKCYQDGHAYILQPETLVTGRVEVLVCQGCDSEIIVHGLRQELRRPRDR